MKFLSIFILCVASLSIAGCGSREDRENAAYLAEAESLMWEHPEKASELLNKKRIGDFGNDSLRAKYALLKVMAMEKSGERIVDDSLAGIAKEYYSGQPSDLRKAMSTYYYARSFQNRGEYDKAYSLLLEALRYADKADSQIYKAFISDNLAQICLQTYNLSEELRYARQSHESFSKFGNREYLRNSTFDLARACFHNLDYKKTIELCEGFLKSNLYYDSPSLRQNVEGLMGEAYYQLGNYDKAIGILEKTIGKGTTTNSDIHRYCLAMSYAKSGNPKKAKEIADAYGINMEQFPLLGYEIAVAENDFVKASAFLKTAVDNQEKTYNDMVGHNLLADSETVLTSGFNKEIDRFKRQRGVLSSMTILLLVAVIVLSSLWIMKSRRSKKSISESSGRIESLEMDRLKAERENVLILKEKESEINGVREALEAIRKENVDLKIGRIAFWSRIFTKLYEGKDSAYIMEFYPELSKELFNKLENPKELLPLFEEALNECYPEILDFYRKNVSGQRNDDYILFILSALRFSSSAISFVMGVEVDSVYNRKKRLKSKLKGLDTEQGRLLFDMLA